MTRRHPPILRVIAAALVATFLAEDLAQAAPSAPPARPDPLVQAAADPALLEVPRDYAILKEAHRGTSGKFFIHFQDAHVNSSAQLNLASALDSLMERYGVSLVLVEGGDIEGDLRPLKKLASPESCRRAAKSLLLEGRIAGEEYLSLISDRPMRIAGIEDMSLYFQSVRQYAELAKKREASLDYLGKFRYASTKLKREMYPADLRRYEETVAKADGPHARLREALALANARAIDLSGFPESRRLAALFEEEKGIDFDLANLERANLVSDLAQKGAGAELEKLARIGAAKDPASAYPAFRRFVELAAEKAIPRERYANLAKYTAYLGNFLELDIDKLLEESASLEDAIYQNVLAGNVDAGTLRAIDRYLQLLDTAHNIRMTSAEFAFFLANEKDFATPVYAAWINRALAETGAYGDLVEHDTVLEEGKETLKKFYESVEQRDFAFLRNAERLMSSGSQSTAVLIAGGYHSSHLKKLFREAGHSYAILTPVVTSATNQRKYEKRLLESLKCEPTAAPDASYALTASRDDVRPVEASRLPESLVEEFLKKTGGRSSLDDVAGVIDEFTKRAGSPIEAGARFAKQPSAEDRIDAVAERPAAFSRFRTRNALIAGASVLLIAFLTVNLVYWMGYTPFMTGHTDVIPLVNLVMLPMSLLFTGFPAVFFVSGIANTMFPAKGLDRNAAHYSVQPLPMPEGTVWPDVTIQIPLYNESFEATIRPTLESALAARDRYSVRGRANVVVNDDGLFALLNNDRAAYDRILSLALRHNRREDVEGGVDALSDGEREVFLRLCFYEANGIGFAARSRENRRGRFKKAGNMNFSLELEEQAAELMAANASLSFEEAVQRALAAREPPNIVRNDIRTGEFIVLLDSDSRLHPDVIAATLPEFLSNPSLAYTQHKTLPLNENGNYFSDAIARFTEHLYTIAFATMSSGGDAPPMVGHNKILRKQALRDARAHEPEGQYWSESRVSEDADLWQRVLVAGYTGKFVAYPGMDFQEGVTHGYSAEMGKIAKFAYGAAEMVFRPLREWVRGGVIDPFTPQWRAFWESRGVPWYTKFNFVVYLATYFAVACSPFVFFVQLGLAFTGAPWNEVAVSSIWVFLTNSFIFIGLSPLASLSVRQELSEKNSLEVADWKKELADEVRFNAIYLLFWAGSAWPVLRALTAAFLRMPMGWGATKKQKEEILSSEDPLAMRLRRFGSMAAAIAKPRRDQLLISFVMCVIMGAVALSFPNVVSWHLFFGPAFLVFGHTAAPFLLEPELWGTLRRPGAERPQARAPSVAAEMDHQPVSQAPRGLDWGFAIVVIFSLAVRLFPGLLYNGPMDDESFYMRAMLLGNVKYITGEAYLWPVVSYVADHLGGLMAVRFVTTLFGSFTAGFVYKLITTLARRFSGSEHRIVALTAALLFSVSLPALLVSGVGTYDAMAFFLFAFGLWKLAKGTADGEQASLRLGAFSLAAAFMTRYMVVLYAPVTLAFAYLLSGPRTLGRTIRHFLAPLTALGAIYATLSADHVFHAIDHARNIGRQLVSTDVLPLAVSSWERLGPLAIAGAAVTAWALFSRGRDAMTAVTRFFIGAAALVPLYHFLSGHGLTIEKNLTLTVLCLTVAAGMSLVRLTQTLSETRVPKYLWRAAGAVIAAWFLTLSAQHSFRMLPGERGWADVRPLVHASAEWVRSTKGPIWYTARKTSDGNVHALRHAFGERIDVELPYSDRNTSPGAVISLAARRGVELVITPLLTPRSIGERVGEYLVVGRVALRDGPVTYILKLEKAPLAGPPASDRDGSRLAVDSIPRASLAPHLAAVEGVLTEFDGLEQAYTEAYSSLSGRERIRILDAVHFRIRERAQAHMKKLEKDSRLLKMFARYIDMRTSVHANVQEFLETAESSRPIERLRRRDGKYKELKEKLDAFEEAETALIRAQKGRSSEKNWVAIFREAKHASNNLRSHLSLMASEELRNDVRLKSLIYAQAFLETEEGRDAAIDAVNGLFVEGSSSELVREFAESFVYGQVEMVLFGSSEATLEIDDFPRGVLAAALDRRGGASAFVDRAFPGEFIRLKPVTPGQWSVPRSSTSRMPRRRIAAAAVLAVILGGLALPVMRFASRHDDGRVNAVQARVVGEKAQQAVIGPSKKLPSEVPSLRQLLKVSAGPAKVSRSLPVRSTEVRGDARQRRQAAAVLRAVRREIAKLDSEAMTDKQKLSQSDMAQRLDQQGAKAPAMREERQEPKPAAVPAGSGITGRGAAAFPASPADSISVTHGGGNRKAERWVATTTVSGNLSFGAYGVVNPITGKLFSREEKWRQQMLHSDADAEGWVTQPSARYLYVPSGYVIVQVEGAPSAKVEYDENNGRWRASGLPSGMVRIGVRRAVQGELPLIGVPEIHPATPVDWRDSMRPEMREILDIGRTLSYEDRLALRADILRLYEYSTNRRLAREAARNKNFLLYSDQFWAHKCDGVSLLFMIVSHDLGLPAVSETGFLAASPGEVFTPVDGHQWNRTPEGLQEPTSYMRLSPFHKKEMTAAQESTQLAYYRSESAQWARRELGRLLRRTRMRQRVVNASRALRQVEGMAHRYGALRSRRTEEAAYRRWLHVYQKRLKALISDGLSDEQALSFHHQCLSADFTGAKDPYELMAMGHFVFRLIKEIEIYKPLIEKRVETAKAKRALYEQIARIAHERGWRLTEPFPKPHPKHTVRSSDKSRIPNDFLVFEGSVPQWAAFHSHATGFPPDKVRVEVMEYYDSTGRLNRETNNILVDPLRGKQVNAGTGEVIQVSGLSSVVFRVRHTRGTGHEYRFVPHDYDNRPVGDQMSEVVPFFSQSNAWLGLSRRYSSGTFQVRIVGTGGSHSIFYRQALLSQDGFVADLNGEWATVVQDADGHAQLTGPLAERHGISLPKNTDFDRVIALHRFPDGIWFACVVDKDGRARYFGNFLSETQLAGRVMTGKLGPNAWGPSCRVLEGGEWKHVEFSKSMTAPGNFPKGLSIHREGTRFRLTGEAAERSEVSHTTFSSQHRLDWTPDGEILVFDEGYFYGKHARVLGVAGKEYGYTPPNGSTINFDFDFDKMTDGRLILVMNSLGGGKESLVSEPRSADYFQTLEALYDIGHPASSSHISSYRTDVRYEYIRNLQGEHPDEALRELSDLLRYIAVHSDDIPYLPEEFELREFQKLLPRLGAEELAILLRMCAGTNTQWLIFDVLRQVPEETLMRAVELSRFGESDWARFFKSFVYHSTDGEGSYVPPYLYPDASRDRAEAVIRAFPPSFEERTAMDGAETLVRMLANRDLLNMRDLRDEHWSHFFDYLRRKTGAHDFVFDVEFSAETRRGAQFAAMRVIRGNWHRFKLPWEKRPGTSAWSKARRAYESAQILNERLNALLGSDISGRHELSGRALERELAGDALVLGVLLWIVSIALSFAAAFLRAKDLVLGRAARARIRGALRSSGIFDAALADRAERILVDADSARGSSRDEAVARLKDFRSHLLARERGTFDVACAMASEPVSGRGGWRILLAPIDMILDAVALMRRRSAHALRQRMNAELEQVARGLDGTESALEVRRRVEGVVNRYAKPNRETPPVAASLGDLMRRLEFSEAVMVPHAPAALHGYGSAIGRRPGQGAGEFVEHQTYVPGDDIRYIDWKTAARSDRLYVSQTQEEVERNMAIVLDMRAVAGEATASGWAEEVSHSLTVAYDKTKVRGEREYTLRSLVFLMPDGGVVVDNLRRIRGKRALMPIVAARYKEALSMISGPRAELVMYGKEANDRYWQKTAALTADPDRIREAMIDASLPRADAFLAGVPKGLDGDIARSLGNHGRRVYRWNGAEAVPVSIPAEPAGSRLASSHLYAFSLTPAQREYVRSLRAKGTVSMPERTEAIFGFLNGNPERRLRVPLVRKWLVKEGVSVSESTVRRDLERLAARGFVEKTTLYRNEQGVRRKRNYYGLIPEPYYSAGEVEERRLALATFEEVDIREYEESKLAVSMPKAIEEAVTSSGIYVNRTDPSEALIPFFTVFKRDQPLWVARLFESHAKLFWETPFVEGAVKRKMRFVRIKGMNKWGILIRAEDATIREMLAADEATWAAKPSALTAKLLSLLEYRPVRIVIDRLRPYLRGVSSPPVRISYSREEVLRQAVNDFKLMTYYGISIRGRLERELNALPYTGDALRDVALIAETLVAHDPDHPDNVKENGIFLLKGFSVEVLTMGSNWLLAEAHRKPGEAAQLREAAFRVREQAKILNSEHVFYHDAKRRGEAWVAATRALRPAPSASASGQGFLAWLFPSPGEGGWDQTPVRNEGSRLAEVGGTPADPVLVEAVQKKILSMPGLATRFKNVKIRLNPREDEWWSLFIEIGEYTADVSLRFSEENGKRTAAVSVLYYASQGVEAVEREKYDSEDVLEVALDLAVRLGAEQALFRDQGLGEGGFEDFFQRRVPARGVYPENAVQSHPAGLILELSETRAAQASTGWERRVRVAMARLHIPNPKGYAVEGETVHEGVPLTRENLLRFAEEAGIRQPDEERTLSALFNRLLDPSNAILVNDFARHFGLYLEGMHWFRYPEQARFIARKITESSGRLDRANSLNFGIWNGEETYSFAILLRLLAPQARPRITGIDLVAPEEGNLSYVSGSDLTPEVRAVVGEYFEQIEPRLPAGSPAVYELREDAKRELGVELRAGDVLKPETYGDEDADFLIVNNLFGLDLTVFSMRDGYDAVLEKLASRIQPGGYLLLDTRFAHGHEGIELGLALQRASGLFLKEEDGVYRKVSGGRMPEPSRGLVYYGSGMDLAAAVNAAGSLNRQERPVDTIYLVDPRLRPPAEGESAIFDLRGRPNATTDLATQLQADLIRKGYSVLSWEMPEGPFVSGMKVAFSVAAADGISGSYNLILLSEDERKLRKKTLKDGAGSQFTLLKLVGYAGTLASDPEFYPNALFNTQLGGQILLSQMSQPIIRALPASALGMEKIPGGGAGYSFSASDAVAYRKTREVSKLNLIRLRQIDEMLVQIAHGNDRDREHYEDRILRESEPLPPTEREIVLQTLHSVRAGRLAAEPLYVTIILGGYYLFVQAMAIAAARSSLEDAARTGRPFGSDEIWKAVAAAFGAALFLTASFPGGALSLELGVLAGAGAFLTAKFNLGMRAIRVVARQGQDPATLRAAMKPLAEKVGPLAVVTVAFSWIAFLVEHVLGPRLPGTWFANHATDFLSTPLFVAFGRVLYEGLKALGNDLFGLRRTPTSPVVRALYSVTSVGFAISALVWALTLSVTLETRVNDVMPAFLGGTQDPVDIQQYFWGIPTLLVALLFGKRVVNPVVRRNRKLFSRRPPDGSRLADFEGQGGRLAAHSWNTKQLPLYDSWITRKEIDAAIAAHYGMRQAITPYYRQEMEHLILAADRFVEALNWTAADRSYYLEVRDDLEALLDRESAPYGEIVSAETAFLAWFARALAISMYWMDADSGEAAFIWDARQELWGTLSRLEAIAPKAPFTSRDWGEVRSVIGMGRGEHFYLPLAEEGRLRAIDDATLESAETPHSLSWPEEDTLLLLVETGVPPRALTDGHLRLLRVMGEDSFGKMLLSAYLETSPYLRPVYVPVIFIRPLPTFDASFDISIKPDSPPDEEADKGARLAAASRAMDVTVIPFEDAEARGRRNAAYTALHGEFEELLKRVSANRDPVGFYRAVEERQAAALGDYLKKFTEEEIRLPEHERIPNRLLHPYTSELVTIFLLSDDRTAQAIRSVIQGGDKDVSALANRSRYSAFQINSLWNDRNDPVMPLADKVHLLMDNGGWMVGIFLEDALALPAQKRRQIAAQIELHRKRLTRATTFILITRFPYVSHFVLYRGINGNEELPPGTISWPDPSHFTPSEKFAKFYVRSGVVYKARVRLEDISYWGYTAGNSVDAGQEEELIVRADAAIEILSSELRGVAKREAVAESTTSLKKTFGARLPAQPAESAADMAVGARMALAAMAASLGNEAARKAPMAYAVSPESLALVAFRPAGGRLAVQLMQPVLMGAPRPIGLIEFTDAEFAAAERNVSASRAAEPAEDALRRSQAEALLADERVEIGPVRRALGAATKVLDRPTRVLLPISVHRQDPALLAVAVKTLKAETADSLLEIRVQWLDENGSPYKGEGLESDPLWTDGAPDYTIGVGFATEPLLRQAKEEGWGFLGAGAAVEEGGTFALIPYQAALRAAVLVALTEEFAAGDAIESILSRLLFRGEARITSSQFESLRRVTEIDLDLYGTLLAVKPLGARLAADLYAMYVQLATVGPSA